jgi:hypothetical protein
MLVVTYVNNPDQLNYLVSPAQLLRSTHATACHYWVLDAASQGGNAIEVKLLTPSARSATAAAAARASLGSGKVTVEAATAYNTLPSAQSVGPIQGPTACTP